MKDRDQKLLWEAYSQLNEALSVNDIKSAVTGAWVKVDGDKERYREYLEMIKSSARESDWLDATKQIFNMPEQELDGDMLEVLDGVIGITPDEQSIIDLARRVGEYGTSKPGGVAVDEDPNEFQIESSLFLISGKLGIEPSKFQKEQMRKALNSLIINNWEYDKDNELIWTFGESQIVFARDGEGGDVLMKLSGIIDDDTFSAIYHVSNDNHLEAFNETVTHIARSGGGRDPQY